MTRALGPTRRPAPLEPAASGGVPSPPGCQQQPLGRAPCRNLGSTYTSNDSKCESALPRLETAQVVEEDGLHPLLREVFLVPHPAVVEGFAFEGFGHQAAGVGE